MNLTNQEAETSIREQLFVLLDDDEIEVRLTKLEQLLDELQKSDNDKEAV